MPSCLPMPPHFSDLARRLGCASALLLALSAPTWAQNKALDLARDPQVNLPPSVRDDLSTIGRYADTVNRKLQPGAGATPANAPANAPAGAERAPRAEGPGRRLDTLGDPFEVSPQLRSGRRPGATFGGLPAATKLDLRRRVQVKAVLITAQGRAAQLEIDGKHAALGTRSAEPGARTEGDTLTVMDGELVDFGDLGTFVVRISAREGVTLSNPGNPQSGRITLR